MNKILFLLRKHFRLFFRNGTAHHIGGAHGIACKLTEDLHHLFLIYDRAIGNVKNRFQLRRMIFYRFRVFSVFKISRNEIHGAGTVQSDNGNDIFKIVRLHIDHKRTDARTFTLEHAERAAVAEHSVYVRVIHVDLHDIEIGIFFMDHIHRIRDYGQRAQPEEIHFQKTEFFHPALVILRNNCITALKQRHIFVNRLIADHHAAGVHTCVAWHTFDFDRRIDHAFHERIGIIHLFQICIAGKRLLDRHVELRWNLLCDRLRAGNIHTENTRHVTHRAFCGHSTERSDLRNVIGAVTADNVIDHFLPAVVTKVDIEIGHADTFRVQETLKQQGIAHWIDIRNAAGISSNTSGAGATPGADGNTDTFCIVDIIPYNQEIIDESHLMNNTELVIEPVHVLLRIVFAVALYHSLVAHILKEFKVIGIAGNFEDRQLCIAEYKIDITAGCDLICIFYSFGDLREQCRHLIAGFEIKLIGLKAHTGIFFDRMLCGDTHEDLLDLGVFLFYIMGVVGHNQTDPKLTRKLDDKRIRPFLVRQTVVLDLKKIIIRAKEIFIPQRCLFRLLIIVLQQRLGDLPG